MSDYSGKNEKRERERERESERKEEMAREAFYGNGRVTRCPRYRYLVVSERLSNERASD